MSNTPLVSIVIPTHNRKKKLVRLINSILQSNYPRNRLEVIVVDDASIDGTREDIGKLFPQVKIFRNEVERLVSASRNIGLKASNGDYIFFIDDDNVVDTYAIKYLIDCLEKHPEIGVCAPLMLYYGTDVIWCAGVRRSMITSKTTYLYRRQKLSEVKLPEIVDSDDFPNCFLVRSKLIKNYNILFDEEKFPMHYEESDFCYKIKKLNYKVVCYTKAKIWHDVRGGKATSFETKWRAYLTARNRILFHKKYSKWWQFLVFIFIFNWLFALYYLRVILLESKKPFKERLKIAEAYLKGVLSGIKWAS
jgi:GT2 family glycosyltransferase